jgi:hypothetical protein
MSIEQWGVLALVVLLPLLQGVAHLRRTRTTNGDAADRVGEERTSPRGVTLANRDADDAVRLAAKQVAGPPPSLPPPLPQSVTPPAKSLYGLPTSHGLSLKGLASFQAHTRTGKPVADDAVVPWLRPVGNLRRAIVMAAILGPPTQ